MDDEQIASYVDRHLFYCAIDFVLFHLLFTKKKIEDISPYFATPPFIVEPDETCNKQNC